MRIISSLVNGIVGLFGTFGAFSSVAGLSSIHFLFSAKRMNALSRSSFLRLVRGPSVHVARHVASVSRSSCLRIAACTFPRNRQAAGRVGGIYTACHRLASALPRQQ